MNTTIKDQTLCGADKVPHTSNFPFESKLAALMDPVRRAKVAEAHAVRDAAIADWARAVTSGDVADQDRAAIRLAMDNFAVVVPHVPETPNTYLATGEIDWDAGHRADGRARRGF